MTLRLEWKKKLQTSSERVKCVDLHPNETWLLAALYNGQLAIWDYSTQSLIKSIEASSLALRAARFIARMSWIVCAGDDMKIRVFNFLTQEKVIAFDAHADYVRSLAVHPSLPLVLSSSDDLTIKCWNWDQGWQRQCTFESHAHYVMMVKWSPRDSQLFASASLDRTIKVWSVPTMPATSDVINVAHFTLKGHERGVNSIEYSTSGDKPYLLSGSDDMTVRIWDHQTRQCLQILRGHTKNVSHAIFHPFLPLIISAGEDGELHVWNSSTYRSEGTQSYDTGRIWGLATSAISNDVAIASDVGCSVVSIGSDRPVASLHGGKLLFVKGTEIFSANVRLIEEKLIADGERIPLSVKEAGSSIVFPQNISHHPNGRLVAICGDGEYSVLTAQALRNKAYGQGQELVWSPDGSFAVREDSGRIRIFSDFEEVNSFQPAFDVHELHGGRLMGLRGETCVCFYSWATARFVRSIDLRVQNIFWSENGQYVALSTASKVHVLRFDESALTAAVAAGMPETDDGIEIAFEPIAEIHEVIETGLWVGECFVFLSSTLRLQSWIAGQTETLAFVNRRVTLLGYVAETSRLYLADRDVNILSYKLHLPYLFFVSAVTRGQLEEARKQLQNVPEDLFERAARFLFHKGYPQLAWEYSRDSHYKFEIALSMHELDLAAKTLQEIEILEGDKLVHAKWRQLGDRAVDRGAIATAVTAYERGSDYKSLLILCTALGDFGMLQKVHDEACKAGQLNLAFISSFLSRDLDKCIQLLSDEDCLAEAALFARSYKPSRVDQTGKQWIKEIESVNKHHASKLVLPSDSETSDADRVAALKIEALFEQLHRDAPRATTDYASWKEFLEYDFVDESKELSIDELRDILTEATSGDEAATEKEEQERARAGAQMSNLSRGASSSCNDQPAEQKCLKEDLLAFEDS